MNARPLDLASRLRPAPQNFDWMFFVNGGAIVLFFLLFGSRFVLAPALGIDFQLPQIEGANADASTATHVINVTNSGQIFAADGLRTIDQLRVWLKIAAKTEKTPILLVEAEDRVSVSTATEIMSAARTAGFTNIRFAAEEPKTGMVRKGR